MPPRCGCRLTAADKALLHNAQFVIIRPIPAAITIGSGQNFDLRAVDKVGHKGRLTIGAIPRSDGRHRTLTLYLFVGIDRTSKFAVTQLVEKADRKTAWEFLERLLKAVPYRIHTILTDNGIQFAEQPRNRNTAYSRQMRFDMICEANGIEHRMTKPNHPWTNGQVERMNRTIKEATVKRYHYDNHNQLGIHLADFMAAYNFARRLKTLSGLTLYEYICKIWTSEPDRFILNPLHQMPGLNT